MMRDYLMVEMLVTTIELIIAKITSDTKWRPLSANTFDETPKLAHQGSRNVRVTVSVLFWHRYNLNEFSILVCRPPRKVIGLFCFWYGCRDFHINVLRKAIKGQPLMLALFLVVWAFFCAATPVTYSSVTVLTRRSCINSFLINTWCDFHRNCSVKVNSDTNIARECMRRQKNSL